MRIDLAIFDPSQIDIAAMMIKRVCRLSDTRITVVQ
jgi:hypothetical protein